MTEITESSIIIIVFIFIIGIVIGALTVVAYMMSREISYDSSKGYVPLMHEKNWTKTEPTERTHYWIQDSERKYDPYLLYWDSLIGHNIVHHNSWWAKATPPPFDGEEGE